MTMMSIKRYGEAAVPPPRRYHPTAVVAVVVADAEAANGAAIALVVATYPLLVMCIDVLTL